MNSLNKLGDRLEMAADLIATNVAGARRRELTVGEFLAGRVEPQFDFTGARKILAEAEAALAADEHASFLRSDFTLVSLADVTEHLREALAEAQPFEIASTPAEAASERSGLDGGGK